MAVQWNDAVEKLLSELGDESQLRSRLHMKQHQSYRRRSQCFSLPVVVLTSLAGSGNFISEGYESFTKKYMIFAIGIVSIMTSIISAVSTFLKLAEFSEANRIASLQWAKIFTRIRTQLSLFRDDRDGCHDYFIGILSEYDRLGEVSPALHDSFVSNIKKKLNVLHGNVVLPYYLNGFNHTTPYPEDDADFENNTDDEKSRV